MKSFLLTFIFLFPLSLLAQDLFPGEGFAFDDELVPRIDIFMSSSDLDVMWDPANHQDDLHYPASFTMSNGTDTDTLLNVGVRLRGNTSLQSQKKSIKISFNTFVPGRSYKGLEKMNINGEHNDPSVVRSKLCWDLCEEMRIPASRSNHVRLYINSQYYGLYINVEHIDEEFVQLRYGGNGNLYKCLWPATLEYLGSNPDLYKLESGDRRVYELKTNTAEDDYSDLANFIDVLNNTSDANLQCELEKVFNVQNYLKCIAMDILTGNWDGPIYNKNNFYLYHNPRTEKFEYIPFDLDNTFGIKWFGEWTDRNIYSWAQDGEPRPIYNRIIQHPTYRKQFTYYINQFLQNHFNDSAFFARIDSLKEMIQPFIPNDPFYPLDYGFDISDFENSYTQGLSTFHVPHGLKEFISLRRSSALSQAENTNAAPIINYVQNNLPNADQSVLVTALVEDEQNPTVNLRYRINGGSLQSAQMSDDGNHQDGDADDNYYGVVLSPVGQSGTFQYYVEAVDDNSNTNRYPYCEEQSFTIFSPNPLTINEFMASNSSTIADDAGEYDDWIELYNSGSTPVNLSGKFLTDDLSVPNKWPMPDEQIQAGEFLLFWADGQTTQGSRHTNFKLSSSGEEIGIIDATGQVIDAVVYGPLGTNDALGRIPNGVGPMQEVEPTPGASNMEINNVLDKDPFDLKLYPNPSTGFITLETSQPMRSPGSILLFDAQGTLRLQSEYPAGQMKGNIELSHLPSGLYLITILSEDGLTSTHRIIFQ
ncbi:MAG: T9SS type A sorting domain-containing protein [Saprospiraceae bacterium]|nr:T9SS type A sorting domain-containing protein [Saprospiraceae bacterium]